MTTDLIAREQILALAKASGIELCVIPVALNKQVADLSAFYHASRKPLLNALEASDREIAELKSALRMEETISFRTQMQQYAAERDALAEQNMSLMNALEMLQGSWIEYGLPKTDRSFQISEAALATGGK